MQMRSSRGDRDAGVLTAELRRRGFGGDSHLVSVVGAGLVENAMSHRNLLSRRKTGPREDALRGSPLRTLRS